MKNNISLLPAKVISLQVCLLIAVLVLSFFHSNAANERLRPLNGDPATREILVRSRSNFPAKQAPVCFKLLRNHKPGCSRSCMGNGTVGDIATLPGTNLQYPQTYSHHPGFFTSWIRPRYYIFLFIYNLF